MRILRGDGLLFFGAIIRQILFTSSKNGQRPMNLSLVLPTIRCFMSGIFSFQIRIGFLDRRLHFPYTARYGFVIARPCKKQPYEKMMERFLSLARCLSARSLRVSLRFFTRRGDVSGAVLFQKYKR